MDSIRERNVKPDAKRTSASLDDTAIYPLILASVSNLTLSHYNCDPIVAQLSKLADDEGIFLKPG